MVGGLCRQPFPGAEQGGDLASFLACATPVILSVGGEAAEVLGRIGGGLSVPPEDAPAIAEAARQLKAHPDIARVMGQRGRAAVVAEYSREAQAGQLEALLRQVVGR